MIPVGPRSYAGATCRIAVPVALPLHLRGKVRELVGVRSTNTGRGDASNLLLQVCDEADKGDTALFLHVDPTDEASMTRDDMAAWYNRAGFVLIQAEPTLMMRMAGGAAAFNAAMRGAGSA